MQTLKKYLGYVLRFFDLLLIAISPLMVIMFIIAVIMGLDYGGTHLRLVNRLEQKGQVTTGTIETISIYSNSLTVSLPDPDGNVQKSYLELKYYSEETIQSLAVGDEVAIRYVPGINNFPIDLVLEEHLDQVRGYFSLALRQVIIIGLISWVFIVIHPEVLFFGFGQEYLDGMQKALTR